MIVGKRNPYTHRFPDGRVVEALCACSNKGRGLRSATEAEPKTRFTYFAGGQFDTVCSTCFCCFYYRVPNR